MYRNDAMPVCVRQKKQAAELDLSTEVATRLNLVDRETPAAILPDTHPAHTRHSDEDIPRLTKVRLNVPEFGVVSLRQRHQWIQFVYSMCLTVCV